MENGSQHTIQLGNIAAKGENALIAQDPLSLMFIFCFLLGFGFFLITALLGSRSHSHSHAGGHAHAGSHAHVSAHAGTHAHVSAHVGSHAHVSAHAGSHAHAAHAHAHNHAHTQWTHFSLFAFFNPMSIALFLLGFGLFGYVFHNLTNVTAFLSIVLAITVSIVLAVTLLSSLNRIFASAEGSTELDVVDRTGMLGKVSITIPAQGLGEVIYTSPGGVHKSIPARGLNGQSLERDQEVVVVDYQHGVAEVDTWEHFMSEEVNISHTPTSDDPIQLRTLLDTASPMEILMHQEPHKE